MFYMATIKVFTIGENPFNKNVLFKHESNEYLQLSFMESLSVDFFPDIQSPDISDDLSSIVFGDNEAKIEFVNIEKIPEREFNLSAKILITFS